MIAFRRTALAALAAASICLPFVSCQKRFGDPFQDMGTKLAGGKYLMLDDYYEKANGIRPGIKGIVYEADFGKTAEAMDLVRATFRMALPFVIEKNYGEGTKKDKVAVVQAMDQFALVAALKSGGKKDKVPNAEVVKTLKAIDAIGKITITGAGRDFVQFRFDAEPKSWPLAAAACAAIAPNIVEYGTGDAKKLEAEMRSIKGAVLWWY